MNAKVNDVLAIARSDIGKNEADGSFKPIIDAYNTQKVLPRGYKVKYSDEWCATFVTSLFVRSDSLNSIFPECSCQKMIEGLQKQGRFDENDNRIPNPGDLIFYAWNDTGIGDCKLPANHIGIVEKVEGYTITVIEGNLDEGVGRRRIKTGARYIRGFGLPSYRVTLDLDDLVSQVLKGQWGNGSERKRRLEAAGYDYSMIQHAVNIYLVALKVINGEWGNGEERKQRLQAAGYDYAEVQKAVNKILVK